MGISMSVVFNYLLLWPLLTCCLQQTSAQIWNNSSSPPTEDPEGVCPDGWIDADRLGCFYFDNNQPEQHLSWVEAMDVCDGVGGYLVEVKTEEQATFIASIAEVVESLTGVDSWWIGLTDMAHEGRWIWAHS